MPLDSVPSSISPQRRKPPALRPGDTVGIVAPASNLQPALLEAGCRALSEQGYKPFYLPSILEQNLYFAGSLERRVRELEEMFERDEVRAIICARGGYGCNYLLPELNLEKIRSHPKILVGYSDITTLLTFLADACRIVTFHGPMITKDFSEKGKVHFESWNAAVAGAQERWEIAADGVTPLVPGRGEGVLYGGCLSMLAASLGTPYAIETDGVILFVEDVATKPFQIDRMLMQLKLAGKLDNVRGMVFGEMLDCMQHSEQGYTLQQVIKRIAGDLGIPVAFGLPSGHVSRANITLPIGVRATLVVEEKVRLTIAEAATELKSAQPAALPHS
jgi:muramoyltetrapeptide carboxypeptidase